jgi:hypothetical protein
MVRVEADRSKQLLTVSFSQRVDVEQMRCGLKEGRILLTHISPGFCLLTDLSDLEQMDQECAPEMGKLMDLCSEKGVKSVIRVVPDTRKDLGLGLMTSFHYGPEVHVVAHDTLEEALQSLVS